LAERHPYSPSPGGITAAITQFRNSFPPTVNAETLRSLAIATKNESYVINVLRFLGAIDKDGKQTEKAANVFFQADAEFQKGFEDLIKTAYADLFALHKDNTWDLATEKLIAFFRSTDKTTALVGKLQAATFQLLAGVAGRGTVPEPATQKLPKPKFPMAKAEKKILQHGGGQPDGKDQRDVGLTVRIEVNLPPSGDQETYDKIFRSIRENLLNGK
jgi:Family of unknown function (DUF5343)